MIRVISLRDHEMRNDRELGACLHSGSRRLNDVANKRPVDSSFSRVSLFIEEENQEVIQKKRPKILAYKDSFGRLKIGMH